MKGSSDTKAEMYGRPTLILFYFIFLIPPPLRYLTEQVEVIVRAMPDRAFLFIRVTA